ncbi:MAG: acyltransferase [Acidimicrobiales bacterium]|nr:acyltransferase [Acidimicrobiales bacterium]
MTDQSTHLTHKPLLDGVRGVLMSAVVGYHLGGAFRLPGGWVAMDLFFVLSGYLITTLLVKEHATTGQVSLGAFYRRRVRRLAPSLLVVLAAVFAAVWAGGWIEDFPNLRRDGLSALAYVANWHFIWSDQSYFTSFQPSPLRHTWSLAIEEQFYLFWPVLFIGLSRLLRSNRKALSVLLGAGVLASAWWMRHLVLGGSGLSRAYYGTDTRAQGLLVGALLALVLWPNRWDTPRGRAVGSVLGSAGTVALAVMMIAFHDDSSAVYTRFGFVAICIACAALVFGAVRATSGPLKWIYGNPLTRHLGYISYVAYLWHWPVIVLVAPPRFDLSPGTARLVQLGLSLLLAEVTHALIEDPIHRRRIHFRFDGGVLAGTAAAVLALVVLLPAASRPAAPPVAGRHVAGNRHAAAKVLVLGDSTAWVDTVTAPKDLPFRIDSVYRARCDIIGATVFTGDQQNDQDPTCPQWSTDWKKAAAGDPDVVVVSVGLRQMFDLSVDGRRVEIGTPEWERLYRKAVDTAVEVIRAETDAPILWIDVPCFRWAESGSHGEEEDPERVETVNRVLSDELSRQPSVSVVPYRNWVCPNGSVDWSIRPDGAHLNPAGVTMLWRHILVPRIEAASTR